jgi:hypothetical protein
MTRDWLRAAADAIRYDDHRNILAVTSQALGLPSPSAAWSGCRSPPITRLRWL